MTEPISSVSLTPLIWHAAFAIFGAFVHAAKAYRGDEAKTFLDVILLMVMSSFTGVMFSLGALHYFGATSYLTFAIAGTGGFLGVEGMTLFIQYLKSKFSK